MFIPLGHDQELRRMPWVTIGIIAICTLVQLYATFVAPGTEDIRRLMQHIDLQAPDAAQAFDHQARALIDKIPIIHFGYRTGSGLNLNLIASAFVHAGWLHLIGNMLFLWLGGTVLEDRWGGLRYILFYVVGAAVATLCFDAFYKGSPTILVGASGAISAILGAFLVYYATTQIRIGYWFMFRSGTFPMAAYLALPLWFADQVLWAYLNHDSPVAAVAYTAHIGGFLFGFAFALVCRLIFGNSTARSDDDVAAAPVRLTSRPLPIDPDLSPLDRCMTAIGARDAGALRPIASRTLIDLGQDGDHAKVLALYDAIVASQLTVPLTESALSAAAVAADNAKLPDRYVEIATEFSEHHPFSGQLPKVLWRLAQLHRDAGRTEPALATLKLIVQRFPTDAFAERARGMLANPT